MYSTIICARFELEIHPAEYVLHGWVVTLILEEVRQFVTQEPKSLFKKFEFYFSDSWNIADTISMFVFVVATVLRYLATYKNDENLLIAARIIFATDIVIFFIRLLQIFLVNRHMGPKIVMIRRMVSLPSLIYTWLKSVYKNFSLKKYIWTVREFIRLAHVLLQNEIRY